MKNLLRLQINAKGNLKYSQLPDIFEALSGNDINDNVKMVIKDVVKSLEQSKDMCQAGRVAIKLLQTLFYQSEQSKYFAM